MGHKDRIADNSSAYVWNDEWWVWGYQKAQESSQKWGCISVQFERYSTGLIVSPTDYREVMSQQLVEAA